jgi:hypothetical protein
MATPIASFNYCGICGHEPRTSACEPNYVRRYWCPDDGWCIQALCRHCWADYGSCKPKPSDYAYQDSNGVCDQENTDEDITSIL